LTQIDKVDLCTLPPHAYILMAIYFLQKLNPPILPVLHEKINIKKLNNLTSADNLKSNYSKCFSKNINNINKNDDGDSLTSATDSSDELESKDGDVDDEDDDETDEYESLDDFNLFKTNLQMFLKSKQWLCKNDEEIGSLWLKLLAFYSVDFGFKKNFISVRSHRKISKSDVKMYTKKLAIEDPFLLKQSLSRNLMTQTNKHIIFVISKSCLYFVNSTKLLKLEAENSSGDNEQNEKSLSSSYKIVDKLVEDTGILDAKKKSNNLAEDLIEQSDESEAFEIDDGDVADDITTENNNEDKEHNESENCFNNEKADSFKMNELTISKEINEKIEKVRQTLCKFSLNNQNQTELLDENYSSSSTCCELVVQNCLKDLLEKVVEIYESTYDQMPKTSLNTNTHYENCDRSQINNFKLTLNSLNLPKVIKLVLSCFILYFIVLILIIFFLF
jgi:hypothetical protein